MKEPQRIRILHLFQSAGRSWVSGRYILQTMMISQFHTRIFELQREGWKIEASDFTDEFGFKSYRLMPGQSKLL